MSAPPNDHTASLSPGERARRGHTPPSGSTRPERSSDDGSAPAAPALPVDPTERYELAGVHARGGLGRVVKALDRRLGRTVAIKELLHRTVAAESRFVREALITARLEHPGIVPVHEAGRWPSGDPYYSMKLVSGRTLKELVLAHPDLDGRLALLPHVIAVAEAIGYAHSAGVIHRDIKPANVVVGDFGETVVVDWGLAKDLTGTVADDLGGDARARTDTDDGDDASKRASGSGSGTVAGNVMGTPAYMSPEQARGEEVDARADVFSIGAMLFEVLTGKPPYAGESSDAVLERAIAGPPDDAERAALTSGPLAEAPPDLVAIVWKATARDPAERYQNAKELAGDLKRFQTGQLVTARKYDNRTLVWRWVRRHRAAVTAVTAFVVAGAAASVVGVDRVIDERNHAEAARIAAEGSRQAAESRSDDLIFLQAESSLRRDPTAAVAWLKAYPYDGRHAGRIAGMLDEARANGVARHIWRERDWVYGVGILEHEVATASKSGEVHLRDIATGASRLLGQHTARDGGPVGVSGLEVAPDRKSFATADEDGGVSIWRPDGTRCWRPGTGGAVEMLGFSRDGGRVLAVGGDGTSRVIDTARCDDVWSIHGEAWALVLEPDGTTVLTLAPDGTLARVALAGGASRTLARLPAMATHVALSPDGGRLLVAGKDDAIRLVDLAHGTLRELGRQPTQFGSVTWSPDGTHAASGGTDYTVRLYDLEAGTEQVLRGHEDSIYDIHFTPDGHRLISSSDDSTIRIWDLATGEVRVLRGHEDDVVKLSLSEDGLWVASAGLDSSARLWSLAEADSEILAGKPGELVSFSIGDEGTLTEVAVGGRITRWDLTAKTSTEQEAAPGTVRKYDAPLLSRDGRWAVAVDAERRIELVDLAGNTRRRIGPADGLASRVRGGGFAPDGHALVLIDESGVVTLHPLPSGAPQVLREDSEAEKAAWSPDGQRLVLAGVDGLFVVDPDTGDEIAHADLVSAGCAGIKPAAVVWSKDGRFVATPGKRGGFALWDTQTGAVRRLDEGPHYSMRFAFSPDGRWLGAASADRKLRVWDTATGVGRALAGHTDLLMSIAWSPDSKTLASCSYDKTVRLWKTGTWESRVLRGHAASVDGVDFTRDGKSVVSGARDGTIRIWPVGDGLDESPAKLRDRMTAMTSAAIEPGSKASTPI